MSALKPTPEEIIRHQLTMHSGVNLGLGRQDPLLHTASELMKKFPHHLVFVQSGEFLEAFNKSAYFLHKLKNYKLTIVGTGAKVGIRSGMPVNSWKRRLWMICQEFKVPYAIAIGTKGSYEVLVSQEGVAHSLIDDVPDDIVEKLISDLSQTNQLRITKAMYSLLKPDQVTFRLKQVGNELYEKCHIDIEKLPTQHRFFLGKDFAERLMRIVEHIYGYASSPNRPELLRRLSIDTDLLKMLLQVMYKKNLYTSDKYNLRMAHIIELGNIIGGLQAKLAREQQK